MQKNALPISENTAAPIRGGDGTSLGCHDDAFGRRLLELVAGHDRQRDQIPIQDGRKHIETHSAAVVVHLDDLSLATAERGHRRSAKDINPRHLSGRLKQTFGLGGADRGTGLNGNRRESRNPGFGEINELGRDTNLNLRNRCRRLRGGVG